MARRRSVVLLTFMLVGCSENSPTGAPDERLNVCRLIKSTVTPSDIKSIGSEGEIIGGCFSGNNSVIYFSSTKECRRFDAEAIGLERDAQSHIHGCSPLVAESDSKSQRSFILNESDVISGIALKFYNLAGIGVLPIAYLETYNGVTCVEASTDRFIDVAREFDVQASEGWIEKPESCAESAAEYAGGFWPTRASGS